MTHCINWILFEKNGGTDKKWVVEYERQARPLHKEYNQKVNQAASQVVGYNVLIQQDLNRSLFQGLKIGRLSYGIHRINEHRRR